MTRVSSLVIVLDGFRPDYIQPDITPNLCQLANRGIVGSEHHAVYPSKTRVNAASVATGCFPQSHGLVNNKFVLNGLRDDPIDTSKDTDLEYLRENATSGLLTAPSLGEILEEQNKDIFVAGSGTPGSTMLLNHTGAGLGTYNARGYLSSPNEEPEVTERIGSFAEKTEPNTSQNQWAFDAYKTLVLDDDSWPAVSVLWISDPDASQHEYGVGHPEVLSAITQVDAELGRLFDRLKEANRLSSTDIFVLADHGFSTDIGSFNLGEILSTEFPAESYTTVDNNQILLPDHDRELLENIIEALQEHRSVGAIFTEGTDSSYPEGQIPGTFSTDLVNATHERTADILVDATWSSQPNSHSYQGATTRPGVGGHGTLSPFEMQVNLIAAGPNIKNTPDPSRLPSSHVDIAPTLLSLHDITPPDTIDGRVLTELLTTEREPTNTSSEPNTYSTTNTLDTMTYSATVQTATVGGREFPLYADTNRD